MSLKAFYPTFSTRTAALETTHAKPTVTSSTDNTQRTPPHRTFPANIPKSCPDDQWIVNRPKGKIALFLWKKQIWLKSTFALSVCEPWEAAVVLTIFAILGIALFFAFAVYLPRQLVLMQKRAVYYLWGEDNASVAIV